MSLLRLLLRSQLHINSRTYYTVKRSAVIKEENYLSKHLSQKIRATGPITVAEFMKEVLVNPAGGYYMNKDVFGEKGDFVTSPEITQMFGEMIAVWFLNEWQKIGSPKPFQIVELGPGRGTLSSDILKVFSHFKSLHNVALNLIEVSPYLSDVQAKKLCIQTTNVDNPNSNKFKEGISHEGIPVRWYRQLNDVPNVFTLFIAHEFFDALPIHKFHKNYTDYKEVLIDIDQEKGDVTTNPQFRYVLAREDTPMVKVLLKKNETRKHVEVSPESILIYQQICERISRYGGIALICDYGHNGTGTDTFRAFKKHKQVDPLVQPGTADLTADVDFKLITDIAKEVDVLSFGPVTQRDFLLKIGLEYRFQNLAQNITNKSHLENLKSCYNFLIDEDKMGERFKFFALFPDNLRKFLDRFPVVGFP